MITYTMGRTIIWRSSLIFMHPCIHEIFDETYGSTKIDEISREITDRCMKTRMLLQNLFQHIAIIVQLFTGQFEWIVTGVLIC